ncbi:hypothetical protein DVH05_015312 [Phytophthora capsici]|nr:hypothetical protein DVH05_015312 [Phytophthora capsici]
MAFESTVEITRGSVETKQGAPQETPVTETESAMTFAIPAPIATVRANIAAFEEDSIRKLLTRYEGSDVLPNGWRQGPSNKGIQVVYGEVAGKGSEWYTMKTTGTLNVSAAKAANILMRSDMVPKFDEMTKEVKTMEKLSEASEVRRVTAKSVMFTAARDFSVVSTYREEASGRILIATRSCSTFFVRSICLFFVLEPRVPPSAEFHGESYGTDHFFVRPLNFYIIRINC